MKTSKLFTLNWHDLFKGLIIASGSSILYFIQQSVDAGVLKLDLKGAAMAAIGGMVTYLIKNYFSGEKKNEVV